MGCRCVKCTRQEGSRVKNHADRGSPKVAEGFQQVKCDDKSSGCTADTSQPTAFCMKEEGLDCRKTSDEIRSRGSCGDLAPMQISYGRQNRLLSDERASTLSRKEPCNLRSTEAIHCRRDSNARQNRNCGYDPYSDHPRVQIPGETEALAEVATAASAIPFPPAFLKLSSEDSQECRQNSFMLGEKPRHSFSDKKTFEKVAKAQLTALNVVVSESSVITGGLGQLLMPPWLDSDLDVANNFWVERLPPVVERLSQLRIRGQSNTRKRTKLPGRTSLHEMTNQNQLEKDQEVPRTQVSQQSRPSSTQSGSHEQKKSYFLKGYDEQSLSQARSIVAEKSDIELSSNWRADEESGASALVAKHPSIVCRSNTLWLSKSIRGRRGLLSLSQCSCGFNGSGKFVSLCESCIFRKAVTSNEVEVFFDGWSLDERRWTDPEGFISLSKKQHQKFHAWRRIAELDQFSGGHLKPVVLAGVPKPESIRQGFVGDCSFLSSLAVLAQYEALHGVPVVSGIIYPQERATTFRKHLPVLNPRGRYGCRLFFNGVSRKVLLDDYVPIRRDGKMLAAHTSDKSECWVTLLEKSFVKLMGGSYCMQGSNPGADLYHLTGWIPETMPFRMDIHTGNPESHRPIVTGGPDWPSAELDIRWVQVWSLLSEGLKEGRCVACLGTSEVVDAAPSGLDYPEGVSQSSGIVARHAYSVLDHCEVDGNRLLYIKNPWCSIRWKGRFGPGDEDSWTAQLQRRLNYERKKRNNFDDGCFWIEWSDVVKWFSHLYLCWNTDLFIHNAEIHSRWDRSPYLQKSLLPDDSHLVAFNPQFQLQVDVNSAQSDQEFVEVWVLLSRHVLERKRDLSQKYLAVHVHLGDRRVTCPPPPARQGIYSNGECTLVKLRVAVNGGCEDREEDESSEPADSSPKKTQDVRLPEHLREEGYQVPVLKSSKFVLVVSQYSKKDAFNFTIKAFSQAPIMLRQLEPIIPPGKQWLSLHRRGSWEAATAGGCSNDLWSYFKNPQTRLHLTQAAKAIILLECPAEHSVNLRLFKHSTATARLLRSGRVLSSGPYHPGCCIIQTFLEAGDYTLIASTFRPEQLGDYQICVFLDPSFFQLDSNEMHQRKAASSVARSLEGTSLFPLPYPFFEPTTSEFFTTESSYESEEAGIQKSFELVLRDEHSPVRTVNIALRLKVHWLSPDDVLLCIGIYKKDFVKSQKVTQDERTRKDLKCVLVVKGDLEGGQGDARRCISSAAQDLYKKQRILTLSHAELKSTAFPYFIAIVPAVLTPTRFNEEGVSVMNELLPVDSPRAVKPIDFSQTAGSFTLQLISDAPLEIRS